jgi:hypothetical protein
MLRPFAKSALIGAPTLHGVGASRRAREEIAA